MLLTFPSTFFKQDLSLFPLIFMLHMYQYLYTYINSKINVELFVKYNKQQVHWHIFSKRNNNHHILRHYMYTVIHIHQKYTVNLKNTQLFKMDCEAFTVVELWVVLCSDIWYHSVVKINYSSKMSLDTNVNAWR